MTDLQYAETPAGPLAYLRQGPTDGSGEPLLLVMGVGGHHLMWSQAFLDALAVDFDVVAFDHRGIGTSARADTAYSIDDLAADALAVLDHLGWADAHVLGISMGGTVAQTLTLRAPDRVRTLILGCTWPGPLPEQGAWGESVLDLATAASSDAIVAARLMFEANVSREFATRPGAFEEFARVAGSVKVPGPVILSQMRAATGHDLLDELGRIGCPTLVLHGTADRVIRVEGGHTLARLIDKSRLELLEGAGHLFFWERPEESARLVREFALEDHR